MQFWNTAGIMLGGALLLSTGAQAAPSTPLWISDSAGRIGTVDLATHAVTVLASSSVGVLTDIAFSSSGALYATTYRDFYAVSSTTGAATLIGSYGNIGGYGMNALIGAPGGTFYAASNYIGSLYSISTAPFSITPLDGTTLHASSGDLAFGPDGATLYESQSNGNLRRITVSGSTITSAVVGNTGQNSIFGLSTGDDGVTYAVVDTSIYTINLDTAALTFLFDYANQGLSAAYGTAFVTESRVTAVPEPASLALLGAGLLTVGLVRRWHG